MGEKKSFEEAKKKCEKRMENVLKLFDTFHRNRFNEFYMNEYVWLILRACGVRKG